MIHKEKHISYLIGLQKYREHFPETDFQPST